MTPLSPLDVAVNAMWDYCEGSGSDVPPPDGPTDGEREHYRAKVRAALLALAEAKLPVNIIGAGAAKIGGVRAEHGDGRHLLEARAAFPAMCRAIAEDRGEKPQEPEAA